MLMRDRRRFLQRLVQFGVSVPFINKQLKATNKDGVPPNNADFDQLPILICSRGEKWGSKVLTPAWQTLETSKSILDAIEVGANVVELDPDDHSVGYGGLPDENGVVSLDASIMYGPTHNCGSVAALQKIKTPCSVARLVMERTDHMMLVGSGALQFARAHGFREEELLTEQARLIWLEWKEI